MEGWARKFLPTYFSRPSSKLHRWLARCFDSLHLKRGTKLAVVAPRGSAKSTWSSLCYPLRCAVEGRERFIQIISDTHQQALLHLAGLKAELEENEELALAYPRACGLGPVWRQERVELANGVVIEALGTGSKIRGRRNRAERPSLIIVDDPENDEHITSALQREKSWTWFSRAVANAGTPETNIIALGTALHRDCLLLHLQRTAGWQARTFRAIDPWPARMDLWGEWELIQNDYEDPEHEAKARLFFQERRKAMSEGAGLLWPEREDLYQLMCLRATIGKAAFASEKQGDPINPEACEWPAEYFDGLGFWFERWPEGLRVKTLALDPSKGKDADVGDYSAFVRLGVDCHGVHYIEADLQRRPVPQIVADGVEHCRQFNPDGFAIEVNQFQELLAVHFLQAGQEEGVALPLFQVDKRTNKLVRIRRLGPYLEQRRLRFKTRSPGTALLVQQMKDFPVGDHDDGPDALEMALRLSIELWNGKRR
jgi:predicted phage terminase large subunit-like protein